MSELDSVNLSISNLPREVNKCIPTMKVNHTTIVHSIKNLQRQNAVITISHPSSSKRFVHKGAVGVCLNYSEKKFPIFAIESFDGTVNPVGISREITDNWYKKIATQIAAKGRVRVVYQTGIGTAYIVSYWIKPVGHHRLRYSSEFKKKGEWMNIEADYRFYHPNLEAISITRRGNNGGAMVKVFPLADG